MTLRVGGLCEGYGGIFLGLAEVLDVEHAWYSEHEPPTEKQPKPTQAAARILGHRFPGVPNLGDLTTADWSTAAAIDILTAGFPCQDVSHAGRQAGMREGNRSGLWFHIVKIVRQLRPQLVVIENVRGLLSAQADSDMEPCAWCVGDDSGICLRALGAVLGDLADLGYDAEWVCLPASAVGAPHGRERVFVVASPADAENVGHEWAGGAWRWRSGDPDRHRHAFADAQGYRRGEGWPEPTGLVGGSDAAVGCDAPTDTDSGAVREQPVAITRGGGQAGTGPDPQATADADVAGREGPEPAGRRDVPARGPDIDWAGYGPAIERWERALGRPAPAPTVLGKRGGQQLNPRLSEWMMGLPDGWITDVPGLTRNEMIRAAGNGVVPQQCAAAVRHLLPLLFASQGFAVAA